MFQGNRFRRVICGILAFSVLNFGFQAVAVAGIVPSTELVESQQISLDRDKLHDWLSKQEVRDRLVDMGIDPEQAKSRINSMTDIEIQQMAGQMEQMPAGAGFLETAVLAFLILVVLEITGVTDVLPNI